jgi:glucose/arabinose dehydrogenase
MPETWIKSGPNYHPGLRKSNYGSVCALALALLALIYQHRGNNAQAQTEIPVMLQPNLAVRTVASRLAMPTSMAFLDYDDFLVLEKNTGMVQRVVNGQVLGPVLDLAVNSASERGLLGIALHPGFPRNPRVYLYWTCRSTGAPASPFMPDQRECSDTNMLGADTDNILQVPLLGNRVDSFFWTGSTLIYDRNLIKLLAFQNDGAPLPANQGDAQQPPRGNHDGGVLRFGPDGKLYILFGDAGRRGLLQNNMQGPTPDDQFGGPEPDEAHFTGVILRLNDDGTAPSDNPFFDIGRNMGGEVGRNLQKIFAYGIRNSFGMAFDPRSGFLWLEENGEDAFDEINRVEPGMNGGWIEIIGPVERIAQYKQIETTSLNNEDFPNLQQFRWPPSRIADSPAQALSRLFVLPGSHYSDPEFSWKHVLAPAAIGFLNSGRLGQQYIGDLFVGFSLPQPLNGPLFHFKLTGDRSRIAVNDPRLEDGVADNLDFYDMTESESLLIGQNFGVVTDIQTGLNDNLFVVSLSHGAVYEIHAVR